MANGTALSSTFLTLGIIYLVFMLIGAALVRVPPGHAEGEETVQQPGKNGALVSASQAIRTPQFAFLWVVLFCNVTAGIGILEQAAPMIQDFFRAATATPRSPPRRRPASSACSAWPTWPAGSSGRACPT